MMGGRWSNGWMDACNFMTATLAGFRTLSEMLNSNAQISLQARLLVFFFIPHFFGLCDAASVEELRGIRT